jgi:hypothetical protein
MSTVGTLGVSPKAICVAVTGNRLDSRRNHISSRGSAQVMCFFFFGQSFQASSGAHLAMGTGDSFSGVKVGEA